MSDKSSRTLSEPLPEPWQSHVSGGKVISPPIKMIQMPATLPPRPRIVHMVRLFRHEAACLVTDPAEWTQGVAFVRLSELYDYSDAGWDYCLLLATRYVELKVETEKRVPPRLRKMAK